MGSRNRSQQGASDSEQVDAASTSRRTRRVRCRASRLVSALAAVATASAVLVVTAASPASAATTTTPPQIVVPYTALYSVDCVTPSTCYAVGHGIGTPSDPGSGRGAIFPVIDGVVQAVHHPALGYSFNEVVCYDGTTCVAYGGYLPVGSPRGTPTVPIQVLIVNGVIGDPQPVPGGHPYAEMACFDSSYCVGLTGATFDGVNRPAVVVISNGVPGAPQAAPAGVESLYEVDCASATTCYAVGETPPDPAYPDPFGEPSPIGVVVPITNGVVGARQVVGSVSFLSDIGCASATTCYAVGRSTDDADFSQPLVVPIVNGVPGTPAVVPGFGDTLTAIDCLTADICEAVGFKGEGAIVVPVINGLPGPVHQVPGANGLDQIACLAPNCVATGGYNPPEGSTARGVVTLITETVDETTLTCTPGTSGSGAPINICTMRDPNGIRTVQVYNTATNQKQAALAFDCANAPTTVKLRVPAGTRYKVTVTDCNTPRVKTTFVVRPNASVNRL